MELFISALIFFLYSILILIFGKHRLDGNNEIKDFFIADRQLGVTTLVFTFTATWISSTTMLALTGLIYSEGLKPIITIVLFWFIGALLFIPLAKPLRRYGVITLPHFLRIRYESPLLQKIGGVVILVTHLLYVTIQIYGFGLVTTYLLEVPYVISVFMVYLFLLYTTFGGLRSVAKTDTIQLFLIITSIIVLIYFTFDHLAVSDNWINSINITSQLNDINYLGILTVSLIWLFGKASHPQYIVRLLAAKSDSDAIKMIIYSMIILILLYFAIWFIASNTAIIFPDINGVNQEVILIYISQQLVHNPWIGIVLTGIMAGAISTANSQLLILTSSILIDLRQNDLKKPMKYHRLILFICVTIAALAAFYQPLSILDYGIYIWGILAFTFFWPVYGGVFWKKANKAGAVISNIAGWVTLLISYGIKTNIHPVFLAFAVSTILFFSFGFLKGEVKGA